MSQANVNIGTGPSSGDGDPLRSAFAKINDNFTELYSSVGGLTNSVSSVAGRTGNVTLTVNDVIGAASKSYVNNLVLNGNTQLSGFEVNGNITFIDNSVQSTAYTATYSTATPTPTSEGTKGDIVQDGSYIYFCIDANTWVRSSIVTDW